MDGDRSSVAEDGDGASYPAETTENARTTINLHQLLQGGGRPMFPWWEESDMPSATADSHVYHEKTRLARREIGLLVDPGAHDNLCGAHTMKDLSRQLCTPDRSKNLEKVLTVSGVGRSSQSATRAGTVDCSFVTHDGQSVAGSYTAPLIPGSSLPALLGSRSMRNKRAILDMSVPALILPGPGGLEYKMSVPHQVGHKDDQRLDEVTLWAQREPGEGAGTAGAWGTAVLTCRS